MKLAEILKLEKVHIQWVSVAVGKRYLQASGAFGKRDHALQCPKYSLPDGAPYRVAMGTKCSAYLKQKVLSFHTISNDKQGLQL